MAEIRLSALFLIGLVFKMNDNACLFGYWHSIFPSDVTIPYSLLTSSIRDPNAKCKIAALQAASLLLSGSRNFLWQAENNDKISKTFTPFSISLGNMILTMYDQLNYGLANENSVPVITQLLKCLSLLIQVIDQLSHNIVFFKYILLQATPFHRLKSGFVFGFLEKIKKLTGHKDPSVVVGSLTAIEFLVSSPGITEEVLNLVEVPRLNKSKTPKNGEM